MAGIYSSNPNKIFFILSTDDYGLTYSGMLKWESTMANDLSPFFQNIDIQSTSTPLFQDDSFNNHDVRVLRNSNGQIVLMYGFIDKNTLVIVPDETIFQSIANKYINSKLIH
jgi:predicted ATP-binding protein involved in virulence